MVSTKFSPCGHMACGMHALSALCSSECRMYRRANRYCNSIKRLWKRPFSPFPFKLAFLPTLPNGLLMNLRKCILMTTQWKLCIINGDSCEIRRPICRSRNYNFFCHFSGELDEHTITMMSMPRCGVKDKVGMDMSKNHTENPNHRHPRRSKRYALQGRNILPLHRGAFFQIIFWWI